MLASRNLKYNINVRENDQE